MHVAVRPYVTTGVALVGASVIAVTPVTEATPPDLRTANTAVQLTAAESALEFYPLVVRATLENAGIMAQRYLAQPIPIIQAILGNEVTAPTDVLTALVRVGYSAVTWAVPGALGALHSIGDSVDAVATGNPIDFVNAVLNLPARIVDAVLNGYTITPWQVDVEGLLGLTGSLITLNQAIGAAISGLFRTPSTLLPGFSQTLQPGAMTFTLTTSPGVNSGAEPADAGLTMTGADKSIEAQEQFDTAGTDNAINGLSQADSDGVTHTQQRLITGSAGAASATNESAEAVSDTSTQAERELDRSVEGAANAADGLAQARSNISTEGQHGLDIATSTTDNTNTDIRDGNKVQPGQGGGDNTPSGGDAGKDAKPVGDPPGSTTSAPASA